ncbi:MAG: ferritin-like domain-containing protein [bacterium]|jgi:bacterioferritin
MGEAKPQREGYADPSPYPEIRVLAPNRYYAQLLQDDYAGRVSEFTAISQYLYHYFYLERVSEELGEMLENVAITEMHHMEILGKTIILLGGNPVIRGSYSTRGDFWNGRFIYYGRNLCDQLWADLRAEQQAISNYRQHIAMIRDPYVQAILERIILDEQVHIKLFRQALDRYCR